MVTMTPEYQRDRRANIKAAASLVAAPKDFSLGSMPGIRAFQKEWLAKAFAADIDIAGFSAARGCGKSTLAGWIASTAISPAGQLHEPGGAVLVCAPTQSQGREILLAARKFLEGIDDLRWRDSASGIGVRHVPTASECKILAASSRSLLGYGANAAVIVFDEVGAAGAKGRAVFDSLITSLGKRPGQRVLALGTQSPAGPNDWWPKWLSATAGQSRTHIEVLEGDSENWRDPLEAVKANPLAAGEPLASVLGRERAEAESDPSALARYRAYRLNHASDPAAARVFTSSELMTVCARPAPPREGAPILSIDTGGLLSWSSGCAIWPATNRIELWAIAGPGASVTLNEADGLFVGRAEVPPVEAILKRVEDFPEQPQLVVGDPHRYDEVQQWARSRGICCALRGGRSANLIGDVQAARKRLLDDGGAFGLGAPLLRLAAGEVALTGDGRGLKKTGQGHDDPLRSFILCCGAAAPQAAPLAGVVHVELPSW